MPKSSLDRSSWGSTGSLAVRVFNALAGYRCLNQRLTGPRPGRGEPQSVRGSYWMRERVFGTLQPNLDRTRVTGWPPKPIFFNSFLF